MPILGIIASSKAVPNSYESIATTTVSSPVASITFSSIPATYTHLQVRGINRLSTSGTDTLSTLMRFNSDTGSNYTSSHVLYGTGASAQAAASGTSQTSMVMVNTPKDGNTASAFGILVCDILDYANTNKYKTIRCLGGYDGNDTNGIVTFRSSAWMNTGAVTSITLLGSADNFVQYSQFALYGIKGA
jgi:hypothetical protein